MGKCGGGSRSQSKTIQQPQQSKIRKNVNFTQLIKIGPGLYFSTTRAIRCMDVDPIHPCGWCLKAFVLQELASRRIFL